MVQLKNIRIRNFKSIGGRWVEFNFDDLTGLSLIQGRNGTGKTTVISAIVFGLYGKNSDLKGASKTSLPTTDLINDIVNKDLVVDLTLTSNGKLYRIVRGLKPKMLDIYQGNQKLNQQAAVTLDQQWIEDHILNGIDFNMFSKIVYLSSKATSTPWLYQTPLQRKEFLEELLGVRILFDIGELAKKKRNRTNLDVKQLHTKLEAKKESIIELANILKKQKEDNELWEERQKEKIQEEEAFLERVTSSRSDATTVVKDLEVDLNDLKEKKDRLEVWLEESDSKDRLAELKLKIEETKRKLADSETYLKLLEGRIENEKKAREKYTICGNCPTVEKLVGAFDFKKAEDEVIACRNAIKFQRSTLNEYLEQVEVLKPILDKVSKAEKHLYDINQRINTLENEIRENLWKIEKWEEQIEKTTNTINELKKESKAKEEIDLSKLTIWKNEYKAMQSQHDSLVEKSGLYDHLYRVANDDRVKKSMYDVYVPLLRKYISEFIEQFTQHDYASFRLEVNDNFEVTLYKNGQEFRIFSLSEGQKGSINLALTFAFQKLIEFKNQINILIIDEILDMSFDEDRLESIISALKEMSIHKQIFIISHNKDIQESLFDNIIQVGMDDGFSKYEIL